MTLRRVPIVSKPTSVSTLTTKGGRIQLNQDENYLYDLYSKYLEDLTEERSLIKKILEYLNPTDASIDRSAEVPTATFEQRSQLILELLNELRISDQRHLETYRKFQEEFPLSSEEDT
jgi:hypothetical protein